MVAAVTELTPHKLAVNNALLTVLGTVLGLVVGTTIPSTTRSNVEIFYGIH